MIKVFGLVSLLCLQPSPNWVLKWSLYITCSWPEIKGLVITLCKWSYKPRLLTIPDAPIDSLPTIGMQ